MWPLWSLSICPACQCSAILLSSQAMSAWGLKLLRITTANVKTDFPSWIWTTLDHPVISYHLKRSCETPQARLCSSLRDLDSFLRHQTTGPFFVSLIQPPVSMYPINRLRFLIPLPTIRNNFSVVLRIMAWGLFIISAVTSVITRYKNLFLSI